MEKKKRPLTLAGCIVNIVFAAIDIIAMIIMASTISNLGYMYGVYDTTFLVIPCIIEIIFALTILILSSILTAKHSKPVAEYKKYSGLIITLFFIYLFLIEGYLQYCVGFCHISTRINLLVDIQGYTHVSSLLSLPPTSHPISPF